MRVPSAGVSTPLLVFALVAGCRGTQNGASDTEAQAEPCEPTLESVRSTILLPSCASGNCHDADEPAAAMDLSVADPAATLAGAIGSCDSTLIIAAGDRDASLLYRKVAGTAGCGSPMPIGAPLAGHQIECIGGWIDSIESAACETCGGEACVDVMSDPANCGECGRACPSGIACNSGTCECPVGTEECGGSCVDITSDPSHCGGCDSQCGGGEFCLGGACGADCGALTQCGAACVDTTSNPLHCGGCDSPCANGSTCEASACNCGPGVSFSASVEPVLDAACTGMGCHAPSPGPMGAPREDLDLRAGFSYAELVGVGANQCNDGRLLVAPGDPDNSYLVHKLNGTDLCFGTQMPKMGESLPLADRQAITAWICQGAPMN